MARIGTCVRRLGTAAAIGAVVAVWFFACAVRHLESAGAISAALLLAVSVPRRRTCALVGLGIVLARPPLSANGASELIALAGATAFTLRIRAAAVQRALTWAAVGAASGAALGLLMNVARPPIPR